MERQLPRKPFPILNAGRHDLLQTVILFVFTTIAVLIIRSSQGDEPANRHPWKHLFVVVGSILALIFATLATVKTFCGYESDEDGYAVIPDEEAPSRFAERSVAPQAAALPPKPLATTQAEAEREVPAPQSARSAGLSPRFWDDIECGIEVEPSATDFEYNGVKHSRGAIRIIKLEPDGVCERQGACQVGDVLVSVDGKPVAGMPVNRIKALMKGKTGTRVLLGLYTDLSREVVTRDVVLAPSPKSYSISSAQPSYRSGK